VAIGDDEEPRMTSTVDTSELTSEAGLDSFSSLGPIGRIRTSDGDRRVGIRVLIANDQPIVRHGLHTLLADEEDIEVVAEADSGGSAVKLAHQLRPDVVVIDLHIPDLDAITATRMIRAAVSTTHVVVMTGVDEDAPAIEAIRAGATAYLTREARTDMLLRAIRNAGAGQVAMPSRAVRRMVRVLGRHELISEREAEVMRLVAQGKGNKEIGRELSIAQSTVKSHIGNLLDKLGLASRTQVAMYAARTGLVALEQLDIMSTRSQAI
jgi:DNA-binding NarL/FixJ family response regulator